MNLNGINKIEFIDSKDVNQIYNELADKLSAFHQALDNEIKRVLKIAGYDISVYNEDLKKGLSDKGYLVVNNDLGSCLCLNGVKISEFIYYNNY